MKLDKIIVLLYFANNTKDFLMFDSQKKCNLYFNADRLDELEERGLIKWEIYYSKLANKGG